MELVIVERSFDAPVTFEAVAELEARSGGCLELRQVRFLRTYFSKDRRRMLCLYEAPDAESVLEAQQAARMPFERVYAATEHVDG